jgi:hypothetical protein
VILEKSARKDWREGKKERERISGNEKKRDRMGEK